MINPTFLDSILEHSMRRSDSLLLYICTILVVVLLAVSFPSQSTTSSHAQFVPSSISAHFHMLRCVQNEITVVDDQSHQCNNAVLLQIEQVEILVHTNSENKAGKFQCQCACLHRTNSFAFVPAVV